LVLDPYGVLFTIAADGSTPGKPPVGSPVDVVDLFGNGVGFGGFGLAVADKNRQYDYVSAGITVSVPEPSTSALMLGGFAALGLAGLRSARKTVSAG
jgi:PEP-CTERM motif